MEARLDPIVLGRPCSRKDRMSSPSVSIAVSCCSEEARRKMSVAKKGKPRAGYVLGESIFNRWMLIYTSNASRRGIAWKLTRDEFKEIIEQSCHYCGVPPSAFTDKNAIGTLLCNGVDRKDNSIGYTKANSLPCCSVCNRCKSTMPYEEFIAYLKRAGDHVCLQFQ